MRTEQHSNYGLMSQLRGALHSLKQATTRCESLSSNLKNMESKKTLLEKELKLRSEENDALQEVMSQTKRELFRSMMAERNILSQLCQEQRETQYLKSQNQILINEIWNFNSLHRKMEENLLKQIEDKDLEIKEARCKLEELQATLVPIKKNQIYAMAEDKNDVQPLKPTCLASKEYLKDSMCHRLRLYWSKFLNFQKSALKCIHLMFYYLLPAMPPPKSTAILF